MITSPARVADRVTGVSVPPPRALSASTALVLLLLGGLVLRLTIAYILFPASGFPSDVGTYVSWAMSMAEHSPGGFYRALAASNSFVDYPPGYLLVLWPIGVLANALGGTDPYSLATALIKVPPMLVDLLVGWLLYRLVLGWAWPGRHAEALGLAAAGLFVFNPVTFYDSALWGQTDAVGALVLLLGVAALIRGNSEGASVLAVVAALVKPQFGLVLIPLVGVMLLRRHVFRPGSGPRNAPWGPGSLRGWLAREQGWPRLVTSVGLALLTFFVVALPFAMGPVEYLQLMTRTASGYEFLSVNAFNPWALIGSDGAPSIASTGMSGGYQWSSDSVPLLGPLPGVAIGGVLLVLGYLYGLGNALWRDARPTIIVAGVFLCLCFFILPTRVHERYLVPVFALVPLLAVTSRSWIVALVALAVGCLINLHAVLMNYGTDNITSLPLGAAAQSSAGVVLSVVLVTGAFLFCAWRLWHGAAREPDGFLRSATQVEGTLDLGPVPWTARSVQTGTAPDTQDASAGYRAWTDADPTSPVGTQARRSSWRRIGRLGRPPLRRDRSATLASEPPGRIHKLDLLIALCILLGAIVLRGFRVAEPYGMYFDEVYHARTAMEFLQDWRYGRPHSIYEYTHPHLAKYAMALGIELFGDHRVTAQSKLGEPVVDAALEPLWDLGGADGRVGDRVYVLTGSQLVAYDLADRTQVMALPTDATALTVDQASHRVYLAGPAGLAWLDTNALDALRRDAAAPLPGLVTVTSASGGGTAARVAATGDSVVVLDQDGTLRTWDVASGELRGSASLPGAVDLLTLPVKADSVVADPTAIGDIDGTASVLAKDLGRDVADVRRELDVGAQQVVLGSWLNVTTAATLRGHAGDGTLEGVTVEDRSVVAVSNGSGVTFFDAATLSPARFLGAGTRTWGAIVDLADGGAGMAWAENNPDAARLYVASGTTLESLTVGSDGPREKSAVSMPGAITDVVWNEPAQLVHAVGTLPDGGTTIYVVDPHGNSVFEDAPLPFTPVRALADTQADRPSIDRTQILAFAADGSTASVDIGGNAWGYRLPGVLMGALTVACLFLLGRLLFRRRTVALFAAALALAEGMLFANSRIAMNDVYVAGFLIMAATLFLPLWLGSWRRPWQFLLVIPLIGVLLGLALASKWVAAYAMGGFVLLILLRSAVGRVIALLGMVGLTAVLGALAIRPADVPDPNRNWPFLAIMFVLTLLLAGAIVRRPVRLTRGEVMAAVVWLAVLGGGALVAYVVVGSSLSSDGVLTARRLLIVAGGGLLGATILGAGALLGGRLGHGPFVRRQDGYLEDPTVADRPGWVSPGTWLGVPWLFALACLTVIPIVVYVIAYIPWANLGNQLWPGYPPGNTGQTLWDLTISMYRYHDELRATHAASSPWWAWPFDLKPVWWFQQTFADSTSGAIYDTANLVVAWMGIPALLFAGIAAWRRRSLPLTAIVLLFAVMWVPWVRIDRATFQYHWYTSVPFIVLALAYLLAELWHGPARLAWTLARVGAALAIVGAPLLWLARRPLCILANTQAVNGGSEACGSVTREIDLTTQSLAVLAVLAIGGIVIAWQLWRATRIAASEDGGSARGGRAARALAGLADGPMGGIVVTVGAMLLAIVGCVVLLGDQHAVTLTVSDTELALVALAILGLPAWIAVRARDPRRFALGVVIAAALWFVVWYPNISGLPLPNGLVNIYQGLLPTWNYAFQFATDMDPVVKGGMTDASTLVVAAATIVGVIGVVFTARRWRSRRSTVMLEDLV